MKKMIVAFVFLAIAGLSAQAFAAGNVTIKYPANDPLGSNRADVVKAYVRSQGGHIQGVSASSEVPKGNVYIESVADSNTSANVPVSDKLALGKKRICVPQMSLINQVLAVSPPQKISREEYPEQAPPPARYAPPPAYMPPQQGFNPPPAGYAPPPPQRQMGFIPPFPMMPRVYCNLHKRYGCHPRAECRSHHQMVRRNFTGSRQGRICPPRHSGQISSKRSSGYGSLNYRRTGQSSWQRSGQAFYRPNGTYNRFNHGQGMSRGMGYNNHRGSGPPTGRGGHPGSGMPMGRGR